MATRFHEAQQPGLRSFIVHQRLPEGCTSHLVTNDRTAPHLTQGDVAVIDTTDREPVAGELFLFAFATPYPDEVRRDVVEVMACDFLPGHFLTARLRPTPLMHLDGTYGGELRLTDGPYAATYLATKLVGRVVGILEPAFSEPRRICGEAL